jgi:3-phenylpropionate/cinnamic acid dioxygenase small subunit
MSSRLPQKDLCRTPQSAPEVILTSTSNRKIASEMCSEISGWKAALQQIDDERRIRDLLARLSHMADRGTIDEYLDLWAPDGVWEGSMDTACGHEQLRARIERYRSRGIQGPGSGTRHVSTTKFVDFVACDAAECHSYFMYFTQVNGEPHVTNVGRYEDRLIRINDQWKLARRRIVLDD